MDESAPRELSQVLEVCIFILSENCHSILLHLLNTFNAVKIELFGQYLASSRRQKKICGLVNLLKAPL